MASCRSLDPDRDCGDIGALYRFTFTLDAKPDPWPWARDGHSLSDIEIYLRAGMTQAEAATTPVDDAVRFLASLRT